MEFHYASIIKKKKSCLLYIGFWCAYFLKRVRIVNTQFCAFRVWRYIPIIRHKPEFLLFRRFCKKGNLAVVMRNMFVLYRLVGVWGYAPVRTFNAVLRLVGPSLKRVGKYIGKRKYIIPTPFMTLKYKVTRFTSFLVKNCRMRAETIFFMRIINEFIETLSGITPTFRDRKRWDGRLLYNRQYLRYFKKPSVVRRRYNKLKLV
jgi:hypothetical protein